MEQVGPGGGGVDPSPSLVGIPSRAEVFGLILLVEWDVEIDAFRHGLPPNSAGLPFDSRHGV
jgi:hypothetical protein